MEKEHKIDTLKEDEYLIRRFKEGDQTAFERLMEKYSNYVVSIAYNIVGDLHIAQDMAQEAFLKVYRKIAALDSPRKFRGWLYSIARSTCIDWLRKEHSKPCSFDGMADNGVDPQDAKKDTFASVEMEELREKVLNIIGMLPRIYQQIIMLKHLRNMSYKEIAEFLGIPIATIESRLYRARLLLKEKLQDLYL
jgi:RNA polymerase sigma-70 factor (ECF subfamily)